MKQTLILALFSFLTAVAGGTVLFTKLMPPRPTPTADSSLKLAARPAPPPAAVPAPEPPKPDRAAPKDTIPATPPAPRKPAVDPAEGLRAKAVAKMLVQMKPKEAVGILGKLTDDEVERIIRQLNAKQLAALMAAFPEERAAVMSRRLLEPRAGREGGS